MLGYDAAVVGMGDDSKGRLWSIQSPTHFASTPICCKGNSHRHTTPKNCSILLEGLFPLSVPHIQLTDPPLARCWPASCSNPYNDGHCLPPSLWYWPTRIFTRILWAVPVNDRSNTYNVSHFEPIFCIARPRAYANCLRIASRIPFLLPSLAVTSGGTCTTSSYSHRIPWHGYPVTLHECS